MVRNPRISLAEIDISEVSDMSYLFQECYRGDFSGIEAWDVSNVEDMSHMFNSARNFNQPLDSWDIRKAAKNKIEGSAFLTSVTMNGLHGMFNFSAQRPMPQWFSKAK